jgi:hypothetical protein
VHTADRYCLVLTKWVARLDRLAGALRERGKDPVVLRGGMGAKARKSALARLNPQPGGPPLLAHMSRFCTSTVDGRSTSSQSRTGQPESGSFAC